MSRLLLVLALVFLSRPALALDDRLSAQAPEKPNNVVVPPPADPEVIRQGGDTISDATVIDNLPYDDVGTTAGYNDDYNYPCPYDTPGSPDVVYTITPTDDTLLDIDLCGSSYDTKLYFCDADLNLLYCNDDYYYDYECGWYVSALFNVPVVGGSQYFIIIDGYYGDFGDYILSVSEVVPCVLECPPESLAEGEPDLVDDYVDEYNGGCNSDGPPWPFQDLNESGQAFLEFCGVAGWYSFGYSTFRDTDWFTATVGENGFIEVTADAESSTNVFEIDVPPDCAATVLQSMNVGPCFPGTLNVEGAPGEVVFLWAGSANFSNPGDVDGNMYDYILTIDGLEGTATESTTWSQVKGLYR